VSCDCRGKNEHEHAGYRSTLLLMLLALYHTRESLLYQFILAIHGWTGWGRRAPGIHADMTGRVMEITSAAGLIPASRNLDWSGRR
jgi:hypothetical protein